MCVYMCMYLYTDVFVMCVCHDQYAFRSTYSYYYIAFQIEDYDNTINIGVFAAFYDNVHQFVLSVRRQHFLNLVK